MGAGLLAAGCSTSAQPVAAARDAGQPPASAAASGGAETHTESQADAASPAANASATNNAAPRADAGPGEGTASGGQPDAAAASVSTPAATTSHNAVPSNPIPSNTAPSHTGSSGEQPAAPALGAYPVDPSPLTWGGTMTFTNVGQAGSWPRRLDRPAGDPACDYKDGEDTWGGHCCMTEHATSSETLSPFDEEMTLILKAVNVKQLAVYQPSAPDQAQASSGDALLAPDAPWQRISAWDERSAVADNLWFTQQGAGSRDFPGDLTHNDCVGYVMQEAAFDCGTADYYCPDDPGILHQGFAGSKLVVFLGSMSFADDQVQKCDGQGAGHPGPWVAFVNSELVRDGGRKWNGLCNCYSKTGSVGDGCGEINVFEVVMDNNDLSNREFASTGLRSYQAGHVGGAVCSASCDREQFAAEAEVVDACSQSAFESAPEIRFGEESSCAVWRRPEGDRYFFILLDQAARVIQVGVIHPENIPQKAAPLLPTLPGALARSDIDALLQLRLPE